MSGFPESIDLQKGLSRHCSSEGTTTVVMDIGNDELLALSSLKVLNPGSTLTEVDLLLPAHTWLVHALRSNVGA